MSPGLLVQRATMFAAALTSRALVRAYLGPAPPRRRAPFGRCGARPRRRTPRAPAARLSSPASARIDGGTARDAGVDGRSGGVAIAIEASSEDGCDFADLDIALDAEPMLREGIVEETAGTEDDAPEEGGGAAAEEDGPDDAPAKNEGAMRDRLREELRRYRTDQSAPLEKPPYTVFTNAALDGICAALPSDDGELLAVKGIGPRKLEAYGEDILDIVRRHAAGGLTPGPDPASPPPTRGPVPRPRSIAAESLTAEQRRAAEIVLDERRSAFVSGAAGTGKSHVSKYIVQALRERGRRCAPTAPTGVAALNVGGSTLHSFFGIGIGVGSLRYLVNKVKKNKGAVKRIDETDVLLIDEVSMLSSDLLELLDAVAREVRRDGEHRDEPMGGMQVVAVGDFFQLPPIVRRNDAGRSAVDPDGGRPFCFDAPAWAALGLDGATVELTENRRQEPRSRFEAFLNMVRVGDVTPGVLRDLNAKCLIGGARTLPDDGIAPTRIYTHNRDVDGENEARLAALGGDVVSCAATDEWREKVPPGTPATVKKSMRAGIAAELPDEVRLKAGAQVMLTRNRDLEGGALRGLVNGSRGVVERFDADGSPIVRFDNGRVDKIGRVEAIRYNPDGGPGALARKQVPLKLAWATTVHKSQGSTLSRAILDISNTFEPGQAYVSLSRVKSIEGLFLEKPVSMRNIMVSKRVLDYYAKT